MQDLLRLLATLLSKFVDGLGTLPVTVMEPSGMVVEKIDDIVCRTVGNRFPIRSRTEKLTLRIRHCQTWAGSAAQCLRAPWPSPAGSGSGTQLLAIKL
jgi:hypothetical protein